MKVVITSATEKEILQIKQSVETAIDLEDSGLDLQFQITGVGMLASTFAITQMIYEHEPELIIQVGIAGAFDEQLLLGNVITVNAEYLGDTGVEEDKVFKDLFDMKLGEENTIPFMNRSLQNIYLKEFNLLDLKEVTSVTINQITTSPERIELLKVKYNPAIESMEGAALHYCALKMSVPFIQIRAVSNYIGERDKSKWNLKDSLENLHETVMKYLYELKNRI